MTEQRIDQAEDIISGDPSKTQWLNSTAQISMASSSAVLVGLEVTGESPLFLAGIEIGSTVPVVGVMIGGGLVLAAVLNYICDQYGWLPPEQSREILGNAFLPFALINTFLYDESTPTTKQLEEAYWQSAYFLMTLSESDYEEPYNVLREDEDMQQDTTNYVFKQKAKYVNQGNPIPQDGDKIAFIKNLWRYRFFK